ncbi:hypothetical protein E2542_SST31152 [Spatholobus suberectus]|nr:hypothetical protein E2542_SST31152 [Spatholobus suberectus]
MIAAHPRLKQHSQILIIPGPDESSSDIIDNLLSFLISSSCVIYHIQQFFPGPSTVLSRCALPNYSTEDLQKHIPNAIFSRNPCMLTFHLNRIAWDIFIIYTSCAL